MRGVVLSWQLEAVTCGSLPLMIDIPVVQEEQVSERLILISPWFRNVDSPGNQEMTCK